MTLDDFPKLITVGLGADGQIAESCRSAADGKLADYRYLGVEARVYCELWRDFMPPGTHAPPVRFVHLPHCTGPTPSAVHVWLEKSDWIGWDLCLFRSSPAPPTPEETKALAERVGKPVVPATYRVLEPDEVLRLVRDEATRRKNGVLVDDVVADAITMILRELAVLREKHP